MQRWWCAETERKCSSRKPRNFRSWSVCRDSSWWKEKKRQSYGKRWGIYLSLLFW